MFAGGEALPDDCNEFALEAVAYIEAVVRIITAYVRITDPFASEHLQASAASVHGLGIADSFDWRLNFGRDPVSSADQAR